MRRLLLPLVLLTLASCAQSRKSPTTTVSSLSLPTVFADHMVLQRQMSVPVWGTARPGETVTVSLAGKSVSAHANDKGEWTAKLPAMEAGGPHELSARSSSGSLTFHDVLIGEVWVCSGQSNMEMRLSNTTNPEPVIAAATHPNIRLIRVDRRPALEPRRDVPGKWTLCTPQTAAPFSAVGYYFGKELSENLNVPIGLIHSSYGGTAAEAWTPRETYTSNSKLRPVLERYLRNAATRAATQPATAPTANRTTPSNLYNGMIAPLIPYAMRGVIWYQGEANANRADEYRTLFPEMISGWRRAWGQGDFPFLFVQLSTVRAPVTQPEDSPWGELREAQTMTLKASPNTAMAVAVDYGEASGNIHPLRKQPVGHRLALAALATVYGKDVPYIGPMYESMKVEGNAIRIRFTHADKGLKTPQNESVKGFAIAGADKKFVWADVKIDGDSVIVSSPSVPKPLAVRYGWHENPTVNLYNGVDLPAIPFRTDDWPRK